MTKKISSYAQYAGLLLAKNVKFLHWRKTENMQRGLETMFMEGD